MKRYDQLEDFTDGRFYRGNDLARIGCNDCEGCSACCHDMVETIILDPFDCYLLAKNLSKSIPELFTTCLELHVVDGVILPHLKKDANTNACPFLKEDGRCSIHTFRPGFCRLFPLGRYYENGSFQYILQVHECPKPNKTKVRIEQWIGIQPFSAYEKFVNEWHSFLLEMEELLASSDQEDEKKTLTTYLLQTFYLKLNVNESPESEIFFSNFSALLQKVRSMLGLVS